MLFEMIKKISFFKLFWTTNDNCEMKIVFVADG